MKNIEHNLAFVIYDYTGAIWHMCFCLLDKNDHEDPVIFSIKNFNDWFESDYKPNQYPEKYSDYEKEITFMISQVELAIQAGAEVIIVLEQRKPIDV